MVECVPLSLLEGWIHDLTSNIRQASEEAENIDYFLYKGMREGIGQVGRRLNTWCRHQKYLETQRRLRREFLFVRRVNLSQGRYRNLEWYEGDLFVTLGWRHARNADRGELMLQIQNVQHLSSTFLVYDGNLTFDILAGLAREGGLKAVRNEGDWRKWH
jgi:hypothetical protein